MESVAIKTNSFVLGFQIPLHMLQPVCCSRKLIDNRRVHVAWIFFCQKHALRCHKSKWKSWFDMTVSWLFTSLAGSFRGKCETAANSCDFHQDIAWQPCFSVMGYANLCTVCHFCLQFKLSLPQTVLISPHLYSCCPPPSSPSQNKKHRVAAIPHPLPLPSTGLKGKPHTDK